MNKNIDFDVPTCTILQWERHTYYTYYRYFGHQDTKILSQICL